jgi:hypothetical protein
MAKVADVSPQKNYLVSEVKAPQLSNVTPMDRSTKKTLESEHTIKPLSIDLEEMGFRMDY